MIAAISARMPSTGRSARLVISQVTAATISSMTGSPSSIAPRTLPTAFCSVASGAPAWTVRVTPAPVVAETEAKR